MVSVSERMLFLPGIRAKRLLAFLYLPSAETRSLGLVFCHPFAEERNLSHYIVANAARSMARAGFPVLRFDFSGCGDSEGELEQSDLHAWLEEIGHAVDFLKSEAGLSKVGIWGLRAGANLGLRLAASRSDVALMLLWHPVSGLKEYIHQFLRQKQATEMVAGGDPVTVQALIGMIQAGEAVEVIGYPLTAGMYGSFIAEEMQTAAVPQGLPILMVTVGAMDIPPRSLDKLAAQLASAGAKLDRRHIQAPSFWDRYWCWESPELTEKTLEWLVQAA